MHFTLIIIDTRFACVDNNVKYVKHILPINMQSMFIFLLNLNDLIKKLFPKFLIWWKTVGRLETFLANELAKLASSFLLAKKFARINSKSLFL